MARIDVLRELSEEQLHMLLQYRSRVDRIPERNCELIRRYAHGADVVALASEAKISVGRVRQVLESSAIVLKSAWFERADTSKEAHKWVTVCARCGVEQGDHSAYCIDISCLEPWSATAAEWERKFAALEAWAKRHVPTTAEELRQVRTELEMREHRINRIDHDLTTVRKAQDTGFDRADALEARMEAMERGFATVMALVEKITEVREAGESDTPNC